jgi:hypothetical protein
MDFAELCDLLRAQHLANRLGVADDDDLREAAWARVRALAELDALGP